jgi:hypothetical protein
MLTFDDNSNRTILSLPPMAAKNSAFQPELQNITSIPNAGNIQWCDEYVLVGMVNIRLSVQKKLYSGITAGAC